MYNFEHVSDRDSSVERALLPASSSNISYDRIASAVSPLFQNTNMSTLSFEHDVSSVSNIDRGGLVRSEISVSRDSPRRLFLVGISGPSGVGKSTLADQLSLKLLSPFLPLSLESFMHPGKRMPKHSNGQMNWETPDGVDFESLRLSLLRLKEVIASQRSLPEKLLLCSSKVKLRRPFPVEESLPDDLVIVVEGFLLFHDLGLRSMLDVHLWLEADCNICAQRRYKRSKRARKRQSAEAFDLF